MSSLWVLFYAKQALGSRKAQVSHRIVATSLGKTLCDNFLCLVDSDKQQILKSKNNYLIGTNELTTPKRVWINDPM